MYVRAYKRTYIRTSHVHTHRRSLSGTCNSSLQEWPFSPPKLHQQLSTEITRGEHIELLWVVAWYLGYLQTSLGNAVGTSGDPFIDSACPHIDTKASFQYT